MFNLFREKEIIPQVLDAYRWRLPDKLKVTINPSTDGGYIAHIGNLSGCVTQAEGGQELFEMVNDALYTYLEIPNEYRVHLPTFYPPKEIREKLGIKIPENLLRKGLVLQRN